MTMHLTKGPHAGAQDPLQAAPNAALLIDFDNVTMGMRSDLSKELKTLLNSDIIKGKVTVQRAYADWRRYPQYIVPLSEASIDLIFAPAYGSNKKNATDIRMAIDGIELIFIRPEIGTYILLTGDSDFSSLVLKLKEYGKYVIGVGIQESSSDILVQNCDEYYSYTSLSGLRKTTDSDRQPVDPWVLVERAVEQMGVKDDVMRSDRLKQVMIELDPGFDEGEYGFSKFSRFLTEASSRGLLQIKKLENGQHGVAPAKEGGASKVEEGGRAEEPRRGGRRRGGGRDSSEGRPRPRERAPETRERVGRGAGAPAQDGLPLRAAYELLRSALERMLAAGREAVRDSDVKRMMLELDAQFDESKLGFSKFSRFLLQASDHEIIALRKLDSGNYEVSLRPAGDSGSSPPQPSGSPVTAEPTPEPSPAQKESALVALGRRFGLRLGPLRSREEAAPPPPPPPVPAPPPAPVVPSPPPAPPVAQVDPSKLGLPTDAGAQVRYLTNRYKGVGKKTAEKLVEGLGENLFTVLQEEPQRVQELIPPARAENVLEQWKADFDRRSGLGGEKASDRAPQDRKDRPGRDQRGPRGRGGRGRRGGGETSSGQADPDARPPAPSGPAERAEAQEPSRAEPPVQEAPPVPPAPDSGAAEDATGPRSGVELAGLEPSRLHTRTSRRGGRR